MRQTRGRINTETSVNLPVNRLDQHLAHVKPRLSKHNSAQLRRPNSEINSIKSLIKRREVFIRVRGH